MLSWTDQSGYPVINISNKNGTYRIIQVRRIEPHFDHYLSSLRWIFKINWLLWYFRINFLSGRTKIPIQNGIFLWPTLMICWWILKIWIRSNGWRLNLRLLIFTIPVFPLGLFSIYNLPVHFLFVVHYAVDFKRDAFSPGFYRVNYDQENWERLVHLLNVSHGTIHVLNRAQLLDDSFNLARAGLLNYSSALDLSTYLKNEDDVIPWYTAIECLSYVVERMRRSAEGYEYIKV